MDDIDLMEERIEKIYSEKELKRLDKKYRKKLSIEIEQSFYNVFGALATILQLFSAMMAAGGVIELFNRFSHEVLIAVVLAVGFLICLELLKRKVYTSFNVAKLSETKTPRITYVVMVSCIVISIASSYYGTEYTVRQFAKAPILVDTAQMTLDYKIKLSESSSYWGSKVKEAKEKTTGVQRSLSRRDGTTRSKGIAIVAQLEQTTASLQDSLTKYESAIMANFSSDIRKAIVSNEQTVINHDKWCSSFGGYVALLVALSEFVVVLLVSWRCSFEERKMNFLKDTKKRKEAKDEYKELPKEPKANASYTEAKDELKTSSSNLGFQYNGKDKEGDILKAEGRQRKDRIYIALEGGQMVAETGGQIKNRYRSSSEGAKKEYYKEMYYKLEGKLLQ
jgi:hypothetical protein